MAHRIDRDDSSSDTDSISLLCGLHGTWTEEMDEAPKSASSTAESTNCSISTPSPGLKATPHVNIPPKRLLNKVNSYGETHLHKACKTDNVAQVVALLQAGISVNIQDHAGWTALHEASAHGDLEIVRLLLEARADVHARSREGIAPLHDAAHSGNYQVVKLLLQHGSCASTRTLGGLCAIDLAQDEDIRMLLRASLAQEESLKALNSQAESQGVSPLHIQMNHSHSEPTNAHSGESAVTDGATETGDSQLERKEIAHTNDSSHPTAIEALLEEARTRQAQLAVWPLLTGSGDADTLRAALMHIQKMLIETLDKQQLAKDALAQKLRNVPNRFLQLMFKSQIASLASRQKTLVKMMLDHQGLVTKYLNSYNQAGRVKNLEVARLSHLNSVTTTSVQEATASTQSLGGETGTRTDEAKGKSQSSVTRPGGTSQRGDFERQQERTQTLPTTEHHRRHLAGLMEAGVLSRYSLLRLSLKGEVHTARVMTKGVLKDGRGKQFFTPTDWVQSVVGRDVLLSSADVWNKVTHRGKPLSYYLLKAEGSAAAQTSTEDTVAHHNTRYAQEEELTEAAALKRLMNIRIIHLVNDEELMPISVLDSHWERALSGDW